MTMLTGLDALSDAIHMMRRMDRPKNVEIRVDLFSTLLEAIERSGTTIVRGEPSTDVKFAEFMGVKVLEDFKMPPGFACIIADGEVVDILDLRDSLEQEPSA